MVMRLMVKSIRYVKIKSAEEYTEAGATATSICIVYTKVKSWF